MPRPAEAEPRSHISPWLAILLRPVHTLFMRLYFRVTVHHVERLPPRGAVILAPTHRSRWDTFMLYAIARRRLLRFLTTHDEFKGRQAWFMHRLGAFPINTKHPTPGALKHCAELLMRGEAVVVFPEGNIFRLPPGEVHPIKPGTAWLALQVQKRLGATPLTILPVRLQFAETFPHFRTRADLVVREPITVADYLKLPRDRAIAELTAAIERGMGDLVNPTPREELDAMVERKAPTGPAGVAASEPRS